MNLLLLFIFIVIQRLMTNGIRAVVVLQEMLIHFKLVAGRPDLSIQSIGWPAENEYGITEFILSYY